MQGWQDEIDLADLEPKIDEGIKRVLVQSDVPGMVKNAVTDWGRETRNQQIRQRILDGIMKDYRAGLEDKKKAEAQRLVIARMGDVDVENPEQVKAFTAAKLEQIDFTKLIDDAVRLAIAKARGKVY